MRKSTYQLTCFTLVFGFSTLVSVQAADGVIQFSGGLYSPPCNVSIDAPTTPSERQFAQIHLTNCDSLVSFSLSTLGATSALVKMRVMHSQAVVSLPLAVPPHAMIVTLEYI